MIGEYTPIVSGSQLAAMHAAQSEASSKQQEINLLASQQKQQILERQQAQQQQQAQHQLAALTLEGDPKARQALIAANPEYAAKIDDHLIKQDERAASYANSILLLPEPKRREAWSSMKQMYANDPLTNKKILKDLPDVWTPEMVPFLQNVVQSHRTLEDSLKAPKEQADLARVLAQTEGDRANTAKAYADIAKTRVETAQLGTTGGQKPPSGYRFTEGGNLETIPGGPGAQLSPEAATKLALTKDSIRQLGDMSSLLLTKNKKTGEQEVNKNYNHLLGGSTFLPNITQPKDTQKLDLIRTDLSDKIGRMRSGAVIGPEEETRFRKLIPRYGDKPETIQYKIDELNKSFRQVEAGLTGQTAGPGMGATSNSKQGGDPLGLFNK